VSREHGVDIYDGVKMKICIIKENDIIALSITTLRNARLAICRQKLNHSDFDTQYIFKGSQFTNRQGAIHWQARLLL